MASLLGGSFGDFQTSMGISSAILSGIGSYYSAKQSRKAAQFSMDMAEIDMRMAEMNARFQERQARDILQSSQIAQGQIGLKAGKVKAAQKVSQASRGIQMGVGSAAEEIATTDLMKTTDMLQIDVDSVRKAWAARMGAVDSIGAGVKAKSAAALQGATAMGTSPLMAGFTSLLGAGIPVAEQWYRRTQMPRHGGLNN